MSEESTSNAPGGHGFATRCVHAGEVRDAEGALHPPLYNHSTFGFASTRDLLDVAEGRVEGNLYTRFGSNPTLRALERKLADLEGGERALVFGAGMAAESATILGHCRSGDHVVCLGDVYGGTYELLTRNLPRLGVETSFVPGGEIESLDRHFQDNTRIVILETPANPSMAILDIGRVARQARRAGVLTVVDNTFASPVNQNPLALDADLVMHSTTKYLGGHSDLTGGAVIGSEENLRPIYEWRKNLGQVMAPEVAFLLSRSLRTLAVRVRAQNQNALDVARFLRDHPGVVRVNHPGLSDFPGHDLARRQMRGFGGMVSFFLDADAAATAAMVDRLRLFSIAASLGGVESLVTQPIHTTHFGLTPEERAARGISDGMVRLSCGLEDAGDLVEDLRQALAGD